MPGDYHFRGVTIVFKFMLWARIVAIPKSQPEVYEKRPLATTSKSQYWSSATVLGNRIHATVFKFMFWLRLCNTGIAAGGRRNTAPRHHFEIPVLEPRDGFGVSNSCNCLQIHVLGPTRRNTGIAAGRQRKTACRIPVLEPRAGILILIFF